MQLSVIIPYYNGKQYIHQAIASCHHSDMEIIVVDDCSPDPFKYDGSQPVKVIRLPENVGQGMARNAGMDAAQGEWITFMDQDDKWLVDLGTFFELIPKGVQAVWTQTIYKDLEGKTEVYNEDLSLVHGKFYRKQWLIDHDIRHSETCRYYEDIYFCNLLLPYFEADEVARMDIPTYLWYQNKQQQTSQGDYNYDHFDCMVKANFEVYIKHYKRKLFDLKQARFAVSAAVVQAMDIIEAHKGDKSYAANRNLLENAIQKAAKAGIVVPFSLDQVHCSKKK